MVRIDFPDCDPNCWGEIARATRRSSGLSTSGSTVIANTEQTVYLQNGLNATVNVASDTSVNTQNPNAAGIVIYGAEDSDTINLGPGNDMVYLGSAFETVNGGGGNDAFIVTSSTIGATINGGTGQSALDITGGGTVTIGSNITNIKAVNLEGAPSGQTQPDYHFTANGASPDLWSWIAATATIR